MIISDMQGARAMNALAGMSDTLDAIIYFGAEHLIFIITALIAGYLLVAWSTHHFEGRFENLVHIFIAILLAFLLEQTVGFFWFRERPFVAVEGIRLLIDMSPASKSFPSTHASLSFAMAFGMLIHNRRWGWPLVGLAVLVGLSRIAAGLHFPTDVAAGMLIGLIAALLAAPVKRGIEPVLELFDFFRKRHRVSPPKDLV